MTGDDTPNPATVEVIRNYLTSAATEMQRTLIRTAYNTIVYEILDFGISIYDQERRLIADSPGLAVFLGANDVGIRNAVEYVGEEKLDPGDVVVMNYPYWNNAHTLDALLFSPVFVEDRLVGYATCRAHWLDLGAKDPGYVLDSTDVHQEGLLFPGTKVYEAGEPKEEILDLIRFNSRLPEKVLGDLNAQVAALRTGERRLEALHEKYGTDTVEAAIDHILAHGAETASRAVAELPDGSWSATGHADGAGSQDDLIRIEVEVTIDGEEFEIDFSESANQLQQPFNATGAESISKLCFKTVTTPEENANHGLFEPLSVKTRMGSVFEPSYPAPTFVGWTGIIAIDVVYQALAKGLPDLVPAASGGDLCSIMLYGEDEATERRFVEAINDGVGWGAWRSHDGANGLMHVSETMVRNIPVEVFENKAPIEFDRLVLRQDSGGAGEYRGGLGVRRDYRVTEPVGALSIIQKTRTENWGLEGGRPGAKNVVVLNDLIAGWSDRVQILTDNSDLYEADENQKYVGMMRGSFEPGEVISNRARGGGGYGDPTERDPELVREDVIDGYVSREAAREEYGVAVDEDGSVDTEATDRLRGD